MAPKSNFVPASTLGIKPPKSRAKPGILTTELWLDEKQDTDGAEGLWRVHDGLYDLTDFVYKHPGGSEWLTLSKGTDITEAFEVHHLSQLPEETLKKYFIRKAKTERNAPFSFEENGFYKTLKREVREVLKTIPKQSARTSDFLIDSLLFFLFLFSLLALRYWSFALGTLAGLFLGMVTIAAHNYLHRKDNFRMYYFQFSFLNVREWRISHVLSHHLHTNTIDDLELIMHEPLLQYLPIKKDRKIIIRSIMLAPIWWLISFHGPPIKRLLTAPRCNYINLGPSDLIPFLLPAFLYIFGGDRTLLDVFIMWNFIVFVGAFHMGFVGLHAAHHHPDIFHDGDTPRSKENYDWGLSQLDAVMDRKEITGSHFLVLTNFGDHALHHLFPTLDHGTLELLYPAFEKVLEQFDANLRMVSQLDTITGGYQQLLRVTPNPNPPDLKKYSK